MSMTRATSRTRSLELPTSSINVETNATGRLSRQKKPSSSRARTAVDFPEPESPLMMRIRILFHLGPERTNLQTRQEFFVKLPRRMETHPFQEEIPGRHLYYRGQVAPRADRYSQMRQIHAQNGVNQVINPETVVFIGGVPLDQLQHHIDDLFFAD